MAQITIPPAVRGGPGSSNVMFPSSGVICPAGMTFVNISYSIPQADRNSTAVSIHQMVEVSTDAGGSWQVIADGGNWLGGTGQVDKWSTTVNPAPSMTVSGPSLAALEGKLTRGHWVIPVAMTIGVTITAA